MAFTAPTNFRCDKTSIVIGEPLTFTWNAASGDFTAYRLMSSAIKNFIVSNTTTSCTVTVTPDSGWGEIFLGRDFVFSVCAYKGENYYGEETETVWCENHITLYITSLGGGDTPEPPAPPAPTVNGKLEQFQNSAGEQIYPRTIIEGIFRQSDNKTLDELLGLCAPKADPVFTGSISLGRKAGTTAGGLSFASGSDVEASGANSHAEGKQSAAIGNNSHAEGGSCTAGESCDHAEGHKCTASGGGSHAEGGSCAASGRFAHAEGTYTEALGIASHAGGCGTVAAAIAQTLIGSSNVISAEQKDAFIGNGGFNEDTVTFHSNCFRVTRIDGVYANSSYNSSGADYAEMFEWADGNPDSEDRVGRFVTLDGAKIRPAEPEDDYILGIVSGNPSVVGDVHDN